MDSKSIVRHIFLSNSYYTVNKGICKLVDPNSALLLALLIDKHFFWEQENKLEDGGWFFKHHSEIQDEISLSERKRRRATESLAEVNFIELKKVEYDSYTYYRINWQEILDAIDQVVKNPAYKTSAPTPSYETSATQLTKRQLPSLQNVRITKNTELKTHTNNSVSDLDAEGIGSGKENERSLKDGSGPTMDQPAKMTFKDAILTFTDKSRPIPDDDTLAMIVQACKDAGIPQDELSMRVLKEVCFPKERIAYHKKNKKVKIDEWMKTVLDSFELIRAQIYNSHLVGTTTPTFAEKPQPKISIKSGDTFVDPDFFDSIVNLAEDDIDDPFAFNLQELDYGQED